MRSLSSDPSSHFETNVSDSFSAESTGYNTNKYAIGKDSYRPQKFTPEFRKKFTKHNGIVLSPEELSEKVFLGGPHNVTINHELNFEEQRYLLLVLKNCKEKNKALRLNTNWLRIPTVYAPYLQYLHAPKITELSSEFKNLKYLSAKNITKIPETFTEMHTLEIKQATEIPAKLRNLSVLSAEKITAIDPNVANQVHELTIPETNNLPPETIWGSLFKLNLKNKTYQEILRKNFPRLQKVSAEIKIWNGEFERMDQNVEEEDYVYDDKKMDIRAKLAYKNSIKWAELLEKWDN